jgi:hypothetical protein
MALLLSASKICWKIAGDKAMFAGSALKAACFT